MKVFISWSGERSRYVAEALKEWLPHVIQALEPWVSVEDIQKGENWFSAIQESLKDAEGMGIFCLTPDNVTAPWLAFEAGALASHGRARVATFLHGIEPGNLKLPLSLFQATKSQDRDDVLKLMKTINDRLAKPLDLGLLAQVFKNNWDAFAANIASFKDIVGGAARAQPDQNDMIQEILSTVRRLEAEAAAQADRLKSVGPFTSRFAGKRVPQGALSEMFSDERLSERMRAILSQLNLSTMSEETRVRLEAELILAAKERRESAEVAARATKILKGEERPG